MTKDSTKWIVVFVLLSASTLLFKTHLYILIFASFFAIFAMSWSFFTSFSGYLNLGHVIFIGIAGYTTAIFNYHLNFPMLLSIPIGIVVGAGGGWLILNPLHRKISGLSFEMVTFLGILVLSDLVLTSFLRPITGADLGISPLDSLLSSFPLAIGLNVFMCISGYLFVRFLNSKHGKVLDFVRSNPDLVKTAGLDPHHYFALDFQIHIIVMAIIGGRFSMFGSLFGAYFVILLEEILRGMVSGPIENLIIYSIGFCVYSWSPEGLFPKIAGLKKRLMG